MNTVLTLLFALGCADPHTGFRPQSYDTGDSSSDDTAASGDPWTDPAFYSESTAADVLLDPEYAPAATHWEVYYTTSPDGLEWPDEAHYIGHSISSLDLYIRDEGLVIVGMIAYFPKFGFPLGQEHPEMAAFTTADLEQFGVHLLGVLDAERSALVDPAISRLSTGEERMIYYSAESGTESDPTNIPGPHAIKGAVRQGEDFFEVADSMYEEEHLVDPVVCRHDGEDHLFATSVEGVTHATSSDEWTFSHDEPFSWPGYSVPFCFEWDGSLRVIAQSSSEGSPSQIRTLQDDGSFSDPEDFLADDQFGMRMTSPTFGWFRDQWILVWASWRE